jgi:S1-C subfamily serine protease
MSYEACNNCSSTPIRMPPNGRKDSTTLQMLRSVVKIFTVKTEPDYTMPWQMKRQTQSTASGFIISGRRILTNAHAVDYQTSVRVRKHGSSEKFIAKVVGVGHQCDLAVLSVADEAFWQDSVPLELGGVPHLQESVRVIGYPTGGDNISVTKGVVSRIEETYYSHGGSRLMAIQIDAAINSGNSGGPVFMKENVIGVAFETLVNADNIGYIIPIPVVEHFLKDIEMNGTYTGFPDIGIQVQHMESEHIRKSVGMDQTQSGILVNKVAPLVDAASVLKKDDVILEIEDTIIGNDATIPFREGERISWKCALLSKFAGDLCKLKILRDRKVMDIEVKAADMPYLVPVQQYDKMPTYFVYAGLVFHPLTQPYLLQEWGKDWRQRAPVKFVQTALYALKEQEDQEVVVLAQILSSDLTVAYKKYEGQICTKVNGKPVNNMKQLVEMVENSTEPFLRFDLDNDWVVILDANETNGKNQDILESHSIVHGKSVDLRDITRKVPVIQGAMESPSPLKAPEVPTPASEFIEVKV